MTYKNLLYIFFTSIVFITISVNYQKILITDEAEYVFLAKNILNECKHYAGDLTKAVDFRLFSKRPFGYPLFLIFSQKIWIARLIQSILPIVVFIFGFDFLMRKTSKKSTIKIFAILFLLSLPLFASSFFLLSDGWLMVVISFAFFMGTNKQLTVDNKQFTYSFVTTLGVLLKPVLLPLTLLLSLSIFRNNYTRRLYSILPIGVVLIYTAFQYKQTGIAEYSSISATNLGQYNARWLIASEYGQDSAAQYLATENLGIPRNKEHYKEYQQHLKQEAKETISSHLVSYLKIHLLGMVKFFLEPGRFEISNFLGKANNDISLTQAIYAGDYDLIIKSLTINPITAIILFLLAIISLLKMFLFLLPLNDKDLRLGYLIIGYFAFVTGPLGAFRFTIPVYFLILIISAIGSEKVLYRFQKSSKT